MATKATKKAEKKVSDKTEAKKAKRGKIVKLSEASKPEIEETPEQKEAREKRYADLRKIVQDANRNISAERWKLAGALYQINEEKMHLNWGYPDWESYVKGEVGVNVRTTQYYMAIYQYFEIDFDHSKPLPPAKKREIIDAVKELHWTKGKCLIDLCDTDKTSEKDIWKWIDKAKNLQGAELEAETKKALGKGKKKSSDKNDGDTEEVVVTKNVSFKVTTEQLEIIDTALELAGKTAESTKKGHLLSLICQDFVATTMAQTEKGQNKKNVYFNKIGAIFGVHLVAVDRETSEVVHNAKVFDKVMKQMKQDDKETK